MKLIKRPKRILSLILLINILYQIFLIIPSPPWLFYYERMTWDGKHWIKQPPLTTIDVIWIWVKKGFK